MQATLGSHGGGGEINKNNLSPSLTLIPEVSQARKNAENTGVRHGMEKGWMGISQ